MKKSIIQISCLLSAMMMVACGGKTSADVSKQPVEEQSDVVCLFDKLSVREEPSKDAKYLSGLNLGEVALFLGETAVDSTDENREYMKIELTDGTTGWSVSYGLAKDAQPAAIIENAVVFERPDLVTKTKNEYKPLEFVAIVGSKDEWIEVVGYNKKKSGWIKGDVVSRNDKDVAVSTLALKANIFSKGEVDVNKIDAFLEDLPVESCQLITYLNELRNEAELAALEVEEVASDSTGL